ncbi:hypothetical protein KAU33_15855 [Candidatus Dependentiae bacterium]|nr:hypothetical protein [Candidatus Dependentiae bacterium]
MSDYLDITETGVILCDCELGEHSKYLVINDRLYAIGINENGIFKCNELQGTSYELIMKDIKEAGYDKSKYIRMPRFNGEYISKYEICWDIKKEVFRSKRSCEYCGIATWAFFDTLDEIFSSKDVLSYSYRPVQCFCSPKCLVLNEFSRMDKKKRKRILKKLNIKVPLESLDEDTYDKISDLFFNGELS